MYGAINIIPYIIDLELQKRTLVIYYPSLRNIRKLTMMSLTPLPLPPSAVSALAWSLSSGVNPHLIVQLTGS